MFPSSPFRFKTKFEITTASLAVAVVTICRLKIVPLLSVSIREGSSPTTETPVLVPIPVSSMDNELMVVSDSNVLVTIPDPDVLTMRTLSNAV